MRTAWIDVAKGIGITAVVVGHVWPGDSLISRLVYMFHMPLFFFVSGYLFRPRSSGYALHKAHSLLVPYVAFLLLVLPLQIAFQPLAAESSASQVFKVVMKAVFGGRGLYGWTGAFWFVTCLYVTQVVMNFVLLRLSVVYVWILMVLFLFGAYANSCFFSSLHVPLNANVVLMAAPMFFAGYLAKGAEAGVRLPYYAFALLGVMLLIFDVPVDLDMKVVRYGVPVLTLMIRLSMVFCVLHISRYLANKQYFGVALSRLGEASLVVMFLHQPIQIFMRENLGIESGVVRLMVAMAISYLVFKGLRRFEITQRFFLGQQK